MNRNLKETVPTMLQWLRIKEKGSQSSCTHSNPIYVQLWSIL